jgi:hypothetical protein
MLRRLARAGFRRGLLGGSRGWTYVMAVAGALHLAKRVMGKGEEKVVYREELAPGETLVISHAKLAE